MKANLTDLLEEEGWVNVLGVMAEIYEENSEQTTYPTQQKNNQWIAEVLQATAHALDINTKTYTHDARHEHMTSFLKSLSEINNPR